VQDLHRRSLRSAAVGGLTSKELLELPVLSQPREKILQALRYEPFLTTKQVARLFYSVGRDGQPAKSYSVKPRQKEYDLGPGYYSAYRRLLAMHKDGIIQCHKPDYRGKNPDLWSLPGRRQPFNWYSRQHEIDCAELFVSFIKTKCIDHWDVGWQNDEQVFKKFKVNYDRRVEIAGISNVIFIEVDRGTEDMEKLRRKIEKYIRLSDSTNQGMNVVFTLQDYRWANMQSRADHLIRVLQGFKRGNQFVATPYAALLADPLSDCLVSPVDPSVSLSFYDL
jgi:hypothetical protein